MQIIEVTGTQRPGWIDGVTENEIPGVIPTGKTLIVEGDRAKRRRLDPEFGVRTGPGGQIRMPARPQRDVYLRRTHFMEASRLQSAGDQTERPANSESMRKGKCRHQIGERGPVKTSLDPRLVTITPLLKLPRFETQ